MRERWEQLNPRERQLIQYGGVVLLLFSLLWFGLRPALLAVSNLQRQVTGAETLLAWMTPQADKIVSLRQQQSSMKKLSIQQLLPTLQEELQAASLTKGLDQISLVGDDEVALSFTSVPFDVFISWYTQMSNRYGISATSMTVTRLEKVGVVKLETHLHP